MKIQARIVDDAGEVLATGTFGSIPRSFDTIRIGDEIAPVVVIEWHLGEPEAVLVIVVGKRYPAKGRNLGRV